jgi:hypothetical protein
MTDKKKAEVLREAHFPVPLCASQTPHTLSPEGTKPVAEAISQKITV